MHDAEISLTPAGAARSLTPRELAAVRRSRRHPKRTQFDYLHLRHLIDDLTLELKRIPGPVTEVLDVWCGSRAYEDLLPAGAKCTGLDVEGNPYGVADVVSDELLPFPENAFDLIMCIEAFQWVRDPHSAVAEFKRVLRPGGTALVAVPYAFEYDRTNFERRYTGNELDELFDGWDDVAVSENGGRAVAWTVLSNELLARAATRIGIPGVGRVAAAGCFVLNALGERLERLDARHARGSVVLPMNLLVSARRPA